MLPYVLYFCRKISLPRVFRNEVFVQGFLFGMIYSESNFFIVILSPEFSPDASPKIGLVKKKLLKRAALQV